MKKKMLSILSILSILSVSSYADELSGEQKLACEAILCLSSPTSPPQECARSLNAFYSIKAIIGKHHRIKKSLSSMRKAFLQQCPASDDSGSSFHQLINDLYPVIENGMCTADWLNKKYDFVTKPENNNIDAKILRYQRIITRLPQICLTLQKNDIIGSRYSKRS